MKNVSTNRWYSIKNSIDSDKANVTYREYINGAKRPVGYTNMGTGLRRDDMMYR